MFSQEYENNRAKRRRVIQLVIVFLAATTSGENNTVWTGFQGCVKSFSVDGENLHFARAAVVSHVSLACPLNNKEKESIVDSQQ